MDPISTLSAMNMTFNDSQTPFVMRGDMLF